ncbi:MAG: hypothetical protein Q9182_001356 [Xanthomendoza sp. 2 TL-2023]
MNGTSAERTDIPSADRTESPPTDIESPAPETNEKAGEFERQIHGLKWFMTVCAILSCVFLFALDTTVVADIQPNIIRSLGSFEKFPWLATAYAIPGTVLVLIQSKLYALFNIKWLYLGFVVLFEIGSAISGSATTMNALIVGRMIAGVGGCGMYVGSLTFFSVVTTPKERPIFARELSTKQKLAKLDWLGLLILTGWSISFFMALIFGGTFYAWDSYSEIILWVFVGILSIGFVVAHKTHPFVLKEDRLYPGHMLRNWKLGILQVATFSAPAAVYIPIYYIPLFFQFARGESPVEAAVRLLPFVLVIAAVSILNGIFMSKLGYYMPWFLGGAILAVSGGALMHTVGTETSTSVIYGYTALLGIGGGCFLMSAFGCVSAVVDASDVFNAIGVLSLVQCMGITFFPAISGCIFQNLGAHYIRPYLPPDFTGSPTAILAGASSPAFQKLSENLQTQIARAIISAMSPLYTMTIAAGGLTAILSPFLGSSIGDNVHDATLTQTITPSLSASPFFPELDTTAGYSLFDPPFGPLDASTTHSVTSDGFQASHFNIDPLPLPITPSQNLLRHQSSCTDQLSNYPPSHCTLDEATLSFQSCESFLAACSEAGPDTDDFGLQQSPQLGAARNLIGFQQPDSLETALRLMRQLSCGEDHLSSPDLTTTGHHHQAAEPPQLHSVIDKNKKAMEAVRSTLQITCSQDGDLLVVVCMVVSKVLSTYASAVRISCAREKDRQMPTASASSTSSGNKDPMAAQRVLDELYQVQASMDQLGAKVQQWAKRNRSPGSEALTSPENDASQSPTTLAGFPFSPTVLYQLYTQMRKRLSALSLELVDELKRYWT